MAVFVVDKHKKPLMPCSEKRARLLLERGKAVVHRRYPFSIRLKERQKQVRGFQTGDMVKAVVTTGKKVGEYIGRVAIRASGRFNVQTGTRVVQGISWRHCYVLSRGDGYTYHTRAHCSEQHAPFHPTAKAGGLLKL